MSERNVIIVSIVVLAVAVLGGIGGFFYFNSALSKKKALLSQLEKEVAESEAKKKQLPGLREKMASLQKELKENEQRIPKLDELQYDDLANLIDDTRRLSSIFIWEARYQQAQSQRGGTGVSPRMHKALYEVQVKGPFFNLLRFINLLEAHNRFVAVQSFAISAGADQAGKPGVVPTRVMKLTLYSYSHKGTAGATTAVSVQPPKAESEKPPDSTPLPN
ncbi:MAG: type 4a pilus biogenesis protein PilO [Planctomycetes bacterium]|nr:type 4a pilus biogenesis protein PilO [Planctomycetota bacterium]